MSQSELKSTFRDLFAVREKLALCLDFDGTLAPIVQEPDEATLPPETRRHLSVLSSTLDVDIAVISGRALEDIRSRVDVPNVDYAGNHGLEIQKGGDIWVHPAVERHRDGLERACDRLERELAPISGCFVEDKYATATVHHRRADTDDSSLVITTVQDVVEDEDGLSMVVDDQAVEIRPDIDQHKGEAAEELVDIDSETLVVCIGDAQTDVDAFRTLAAIDTETVQVSVDGELPASGHTLESPADVEVFLQWLRTELGDSGN